MQEMMDKPNVKVSVVMCTYNGEAFVKDQIYSIINQTYPINELLVFDDASTDNTVVVITELLSKYPSIKLIVNEKNIGFTRNFEQAIKAASGDVIAISDQDDIWTAEKIEKMMKVWKKESPLIYCDSYVFSNIPPKRPELPKFIQFEGTDARKIFLTNTVSGHAILIKKQLVPLILPFKEGVMYDWWTAVVAAYNGGVQHFNEVLVFHRSHAQNITVNVMDRFTKAEQRYLHKKLLITQSEKFLTALNIPPTHKDFLEEYLGLMKESLTKRFHIPLFLFILSNRRLLLHNKKRNISIISNIKHSYLRTYQPRNIQETLVKKLNTIQIQSNEVK